jgi:signal transduction histidine kinase
LTSKTDLKILLIEDNEDFSELLTANFKMAGSKSRIDIVPSGEEALNRLGVEGGNYDVIILDYLLPGMDGIDFLKALESGEFDIPSIVLTGQGSEKVAVRALKSGASDYLVKDVSSFQILPTVVERVYQRKQMEKHNQELQQKILQQNQELAEINRNLMFYSKEFIKSERVASLLFFVRSISHELNNPLAGIVGFSELLLNKVSPGDPIREDIEEIRSCAYRVKDIVSKLAKFCGKEKQKARNLNLHEMLDETISFFQAEAEHGHVEVIKKYDNKDFQIYGVSVNLQQAIISFFVNAKETMPGGGKLTISTRSLNDSVEISISDIGVGIEKENLDKIFSPFFLVGKGDKTLGMGLAVTYGIIKEHGGEIKVESEPGKGTTFRITFPLV